MERVAQCTFEDVEVPVENLIGPEGQGWGIAKYLLTLERLGIAEVAASRACLVRLKALASAERRGNEPLLLEPALLHDMAAVEAELDAVEATEYRFLFDPQSNGELGPESSILKIQGTMIRQRLTELTMRVAGPFAQATGTNLPSSVPDEARSFAAWATRHYLNFRKISIYGGSNEIQRNIVAKAVLGL
jgi:alkylation response protein AidB-like acyl-CoA dehydrogenase